MGWPYFLKSPKILETRLLSEAKYVCFLLVSHCAKPFFYCILVEIAESIDNTGA